MNATRETSVADNFTLFYSAVMVPAGIAYGSDQYVEMKRSFYQGWLGAMATALEISEVYGDDEDSAADNIQKWSTEIETWFARGAIDL